MAQGQVQGGAIPTAINFLKMDQSLPVRPYYVPQSRDFEGLGGQGYLLTQRPGRGILFIYLWVRGGRGVRFWDLPLPNKLNGLCDPWI